MAHVPTKTCQMSTSFSSWRKRHHEETNTNCAGRRIRYIYSFLSATNDLLHYRAFRLLGKRGKQSRRTNLKSAIRYENYSRNYRTRRFSCFHSALIVSLIEIREGIYYNKREQLKIVCLSTYYVVKVFDVLHKFTSARYLEKYSILIS